MFRTGRLKKYQLIGGTLAAALALGVFAPAKAEAKKPKAAPLHGEEAPAEPDHMKELKGELLIAASEAKAIQQLKRLIAKHKGSSLEPGLWFRLAELYLRRAKTARFFEMNRDNNTVVRFAPMVATKASAKGHIQDAVNTYEMIQNKFPKFMDMDLVLFNNAFARQQIAQNEKAKGLYRRLIEKYPNSQLIPDAHLALGEMLFDDRSFQAALNEFEAIKKYPESRVYSYGIYKAAWSYYNMQQTAKGLKELELVVQIANQAQEKVDSKLNLRKEALNDMVLFFSDIFQSKDAFAYLYKQAGADDVGPLMLKLAKLYSHHGKYKDLEMVLREYIDELPYSRERAKAHESLVVAYETTKDRTKAINELASLSKICDAKSSWAKKVASGEQAGEAEEMTVHDPVGECNKIFNGMTSKLAADWHTLWIKKKDDLALGDAAEKAYALYLSGNAENEKKAKARFSYAEILFQRSKFREASQQYTIVGEIVKDTKTNHDAVYGALVSLENAVKGTWSDADEEQFKKLVKMYFTNHPKGPYLSELQFKQAFIAYEKKKFDEAAPQFKKLALENPKAPKALKAQDLYLDILNIKKDFKELRQFASQWSKSSADPERRAKLNKIYQEAYFADIQRMEEKGELTAAISEYKAFTNENPNSPLAVEAWWNANQLEYKLDRLLDAARSSHKFSKLFPMSPKAKDALVQAAQTFELMGQLKSAADVLEELAKIDQKESEKWLMIAANFRLLTGSDERARSLFTQLSGSPKKDIAQSALAQWEMMEKRSGREEARKKVVKMMVAKGIEPQTSQARFEQVKAAFDRNDHKTAFRLAVDVLNDKSLNRYARAGSRFIQARVLEHEFRAQSVKSSVERVAIVLGLKTEKLEKAQRAYQEVIKMGEPEFTVAGLRQLSGMYDHYVQAIRKMEFSTPLKPEEQAALEEEFEKLTTPIEEKAVETQSEALKQAKKLEMRDGTIAQIQVELNRLNMRPSETTVFNIEVPQIVLPKVSNAGNTL
ncbi:MAG TPA: tetratricopeptide repeat protein [Bdellovibrionales bacterium]|nr:tetratricopeptide repeat protein [Bdellovibrionales bacterium]